MRHWHTPTLPESAARSNASACRSTNSAARRPRPRSFVTPSNTALCADEPSGANPQAELGVFRHYDATERLGAAHLTEHVPYTDETRYRQRWLRGPFSPVQGNLDHMLTPGSKIPSELLERQNEMYRAIPI